MTLYVIGVICLRNKKKTIKIVSYRFRKVKQKEFAIGATREEKRVLVANLPGWGRN